MASSLDTHSLLVRFMGRLIQAQGTTYMPAGGAGSEFTPDEIAVLEQASQVAYALEGVANPDRRPLRLTRYPTSEEMLVEAKAEVSRLSLAFLEEEAQTRDSGPSRLESPLLKQITKELAAARTWKERLEEIQRQTDAVNVVNAANAGSGADSQGTSEGMRSDAPTFDWDLG